MRPLLFAITLLLVPMTAHAAGSRWIGQPAPDFTAVTSDGKQVTLSSLKGKGVIVNFWATWCAPCKAEMPDLNKMIADHLKLAVLGVNYQQPPQAVTRFAKKVAVSFPLLIDEEGEISSRYGVVGLPTSFLLDTEGVVVAVLVGILNEERLAPWIEKMGID